jgi:hypothetical protein
MRQIPPTPGQHFIDLLIDAAARIPDSPVRETVYRESPCTPPFTRIKP